MKHKHIGIVGGLSPSSTSEYYDIICSNFNKKAGGWNYPNISIRSLNLQKIADLFNADKWDEMADMIIEAIKGLEKAGAEFAAIATNTPHNAYDQISRKSPLFVLSIMDATAAAIKKDGLSKVGLLGTKPTIKYSYYQKTFSKQGIETVIPSSEDREFVNKVIWDELVHGVIKDESREGYLKIIEKMDVSGVILGCTEIPLLVKKCAVKIYDTTTIHAEAILDYSMQ